MKTKPLIAAQIDKLAQRLSETPIALSASVKKAGDILAPLLSARSARRARSLFPPFGKGAKKIYITHARLSPNDP